MQRLWAGALWLASLAGLQPATGATGRVLQTVTPSGGKEDTSVYATATLEIRQISAHVYEHTTFMDVSGYGRVPCNGMIVVDAHDAVVLDTPPDDRSAEELISFLRRKGIRVTAVVATHFHRDCVGGLKAFHRHGIASYANARTISLLQRQSGATIPRHAFDSLLELQAGRCTVHVRYFGEGHTADNVVGYVAADKVLFGGCLIKALGADKGNLDDANTAAWPATVSRVRASYPDVRLVIPGHGAVGDSSLLGYTIRLFR